MMGTMSLSDCGPSMMGTMSLSDCGPGMYCLQTTLSLMNSCDQI